MRKVRFDHLKHQVFNMSCDTLTFPLIEICTNKIMVALFMRSVLRTRIIMPPSDLRSLGDIAMFMF